MISKNKGTQDVINTIDEKKWIINISSRQSTHIENDLLRKGLNFPITSKTLGNKDIIAAIEDGVMYLEKEDAYINCAQINLTFQNFKSPKYSFSKDECIVFK